MEKNINNQNKVKMKIQGDLIIRKGEEKKYKNVTEVSGYVYVREGAKFSAPALTEVSGYVDVREGAKFSAPALTEVSGSVYVLEGAKFSAPALTKSGYVEVLEGAKFSAPALRSCESYLRIKNRKFKYTRFDGFIFYVENIKTSKGIKISSGIFNVKITDNEVVFENGFIVEKDNFTAHAETLKKAISDLNFKIKSEKLKNEPITMETVMTDNYYRLITGACEIGVKNWKQQHNILVDEIKVKDLLPILEKSNAYGVERFKSLIKGV